MDNRNGLTYFGANKPVAFYLLAFRRYIKKDRQFTCNVTLWHLSHIRFCSGNTTVHSVCWWATSRCQLHNNTALRNNAFWQIYVAGNNKTYVCLHVKWPVLHYIKGISVCPWPSLDVLHNVAKQIVNRYAVSQHCKPFHKAFYEIRWN
jgi:hypothetical protein